jgi:anti-anti-sigma factor
MISVTVQSDQSIPLVIPAGRIDATTNGEFEQALLPLIENENCLILDLSQCIYLSSAGIRTLLITERKLKAAGGGMYLCCLLPEVYQIIEMAGMLQILRVSGTIAEARTKILRLRELADGSHKWQAGPLSLEFYPAEGKKQPALFWKNQGIAGYDELGFSVGIGSPADKPEEDEKTQGIFISTGSCTGFLPDNRVVPPDFRIPQNPAAAGIFVSRALSFGKLPTGFVRITEPASISLGRLAEELLPIKQQSLEEEANLMTLVVANFNIDKPSVSLFLVVDSDLTDALKQSGFPEIERLISLSPQGAGLWGARFLLGDVPDTLTDTTMTHFLEKVLTFENIVDVENIQADDQVINPVTWMFISKGLDDCITRRLLIETEDDSQLPPHKAFLVRRLYTDSARLIIKQIHGGYSAQTFQVTSFDSEGRKLRPTVLKIADRAMISRESDRCKRYANPYILNNSAMVLGTEFFGDIGALRYNFVGIGGEQTRLKWLTHYFNNWQTEQLEPLFDKIFLQILNPWYGQPIPEPIYPFRDHDPTFTFFPQLCRTASDELSVSSDDQYFTFEETGQKLINPYWFLKHEFTKRRETAIGYYTSVCHGDLNMQNILLDEDMNVYLIDFSETRPRSLVSDFARLEAIFMIEHAPLANAKEREEYFRFISQFYNSVTLNEPPVNSYRGVHRDKVSRNVSLTLKMREFAAKGVQGDPNPVPYCLALLEWTLPIVCYSGPSTDHKRLSMVVSGLLCKIVIDNT